MNVATELAIKENDKKEEKTDEELVPKELHAFLVKKKPTNSLNLNLGITRLK